MVLLGKASVEFWESLNIKNFTANTVFWESSILPSSTQSKFLNSVKSLKNKIYNSSTRRTELTFQYYLEKICHNVSGKPCIYLCLTLGRKYI